MQSTLGTKHSFLIYIKLNVCFDLQQKLYMCPLDPSFLSPIGASNRHVYGEFLQWMMMIRFILETAEKILVTFQIFETDQNV